MVKTRVSCLSVVATWITESASDCPSVKKSTTRGLGLSTWAFSAANSATSRLVLPPSCISSMYSAAFARMSLVTGSGVLNKVSTRSSNNITFTRSLSLKRRRISRHASRACFSFSPVMLLERSMTRVTSLGNPVGRVLAGEARVSAKYPSWPWFRCT